MNTSEKLETNAEIKMQNEIVLDEQSFEDDTFDYSYTYKYHYTYTYD